MGNLPLTHRMVAVHLGIINLGCGIAILVGGLNRFPPPTYQAMVEVSHGNVWIFGLMFMVSGTFLCVQRFPVLGHVFGLIFMNVVAALFLISLVSNPRSGATEWWIYFSLGTLHGLVGSMAWFDAKRERNGR